jgi:hypothetical protein
MPENVWKLPHIAGVWHNTRTAVVNNKKLLIGIAGAASIAMFFFFKSRKDDAPVFERTLVQMNAVEEQAVQQMSRLQYIESLDQAAGILHDSTLPEWQRFRRQVAATNKLKLGKELGEKRQLLTEYAELRVQQSHLLYKAFKENTSAYDRDLSMVYNKINGVLDRLQN